MWVPEQYVNADPVPYENCEYCNGYHKGGCHKEPKFLRECRRLLEERRLEVLKEFRLDPYTKFDFIDPE